MIWNFFSSKKPWKMNDYLQMIVISIPKFSMNPFLILPRIVLKIYLFLKYMKLIKKLIIKSMGKMDLRRLKISVLILLNKLNHLN